MGLWNLQIINCRYYIVNLFQALIFKYIGFTKLNQKLNLLNLLNLLRASFIKSTDLHGIKIMFSLFNLMSSNSWAAF